MPDNPTPATADRTAVLREAADHLARQADHLWAPGRTAHTVMHADADELRRWADEAQQPTVADEEQRELRAELEGLRKDADYFQGWAVGNGNRLNTALADNARLRAELEQDAAITKEVMDRADEDMEGARETARYFKALAEQAQAWGEQHRDRANRYRTRTDAVTAECRALNSETKGLNPFAMAGRRDAVARIRAALQTIRHDTPVPDDPRITALEEQAAGRAAVLEEAAVLLTQRASSIDALSSSDYGTEAEVVRALDAAANELRRRAAEVHAAVPDTVRPASGPAAKEGRYTADTITDDALGELYARITTLQRVAAGSAAGPQGEQP
ncbi:hypothetical protein [Streptomyces sp. NPDC051569]|uniref:hypothetical protein n=1 Tax=Streptomyces sp. NPDC051569 TaxID=3365661 RepID=UPI00378C7530